MVLSCGQLELLRISLLLSLQACAGDVGGVGGQRIATSVRQGVSDVEKKVFTLLPLKPPTLHSLSADGVEFRATGTPSGIPSGGVGGVGGQRIATRARQGASEVEETVFALLPPIPPTLYSLSADGVELQASGTPSGIPAGGAVDRGLPRRCAI